MTARAPARASRLRSRPADAPTIDRAVTGTPEEWPSGLIALYRDRRTALVRLAYLLTSDRDAAEELVQDAVVAVRARWDDVDEPAAYLRTAVVNRCRSWLRRQRTARTHPPTPPEPSLQEPDELWDALGGLDERRRTAIVDPTSGPPRFVDDHRAATPEQVVSDALDDVAATSDADVVAVRTVELGDAVAHHYEVETALGAIDGYAVAREDLDGSGWGIVAIVSNAIDLSGVEVTAGGIVAGDVRLDRNAPVQGELRGLDGSLLGEVAAATDESSGSVRPVVSLTPLAAPAPALLTVVVEAPSTGPGTGDDAPIAALARLVLPRGAPDDSGDGAAPTSTTEPEPGATSTTAPPEATTTVPPDTTTTTTRPVRGDWGQLPDHPLVGRALPTIPGIEPRHLRNAWTVVVVSSMGGPDLDASGAALLTARTLYVANRSKVRPIVVGIDATDTALRDGLAAIDGLAFRRVPVARAALGPWSLPGVPTVFLVDPQGRVGAVFEGSDGPIGDLAAALDALDAAAGHPPVGPLNCDELGPDGQPNC